jgi:hypothetical protein
MRVWRKMLLLERIRELFDAECKFSERSFKVGIFDSDYANAERLRKSAISVYEGDEMERCERFCEEAEAFGVSKRGKLEQHIRGQQL